MCGHHCLCPPSTAFAHIHYLHCMTAPVCSGVLFPLGFFYFLYLLVLFTLQRFPHITPQHVSMSFSSSFSLITVTPHANPSQFLSFSSFFLLSPFFSSFRNEGAPAHPRVRPGRPHWAPQSQRRPSLLAGVRGKIKDKASEQKTQLTPVIHWNQNPSENAFLSETRWILGRPGLKKENHVPICFMNLFSKPLKNLVCTFRYICFLFILWSEK